MADIENYNANKMTDEEREALVLSLRDKMSASQISKHTGFSVPFVNTVIRRVIRNSPKEPKLKKHKKEHKPIPDNQMILHSRAETPQKTFEEILAYRKYRYLPWCGVAYFNENTDRLSIGEERRMQEEHDVLFLNRHSASNRNDKFLI